jgi:Subtilase family
MKTRGKHAHFRVQAAAAFGLLLSMIQSSSAQNSHPPPKPAIAPLIAQHYPNDSDGDRIDDGLAGHLRDALAEERTAKTPAEKSAAQARLNTLAGVELIFTEPVTQRQIDRFLSMGGEITYMYKAVSYGWNGRIPLARVSELPSAMGSALVLVEAPQETTGGMLNATRTGRVRPTWTPGFAGSASGFSGDTNITIAIVDTGVDTNHIDLTGRGVYFSDFTDDPIATSLDPHGHGSAVAGVALGSGAASAAAAGPLSFTFFSSLASISENAFIIHSVDLPTNSVKVTVTATWNGGGPAGTRLYWASRSKTVTSTSAAWSPVASIVGTSPLTLTTTLTPSADRVYTTALLQSNSITDYVVKYTISNYPASDDGFTRMRGVAPGCNWAAARTLTNGFSGVTSWSSAAVDDLVANRVEKNIKLINFSILVNGDPGRNGTLRQKVNSAVNNGIMVVALAGNHGNDPDHPAYSTQEISDPGRAALALTVGAANDRNQLTYYTSHGFSNPSSLAGQEEDYKPDLIRTIDSNTSDGPAFPELRANDYFPFGLGGNGGTSVSAPFSAGCAALVIQAMQKQGIEWDFSSSRHPLFVKMLLCATASESNQPREGAGGSDPTLDRDNPGPNGYPIGKDPYEGYGMINPDAAIEAVSLVCTNGISNNVIFGGGTTDRRVWARTVNLTGGHLFTASLELPPTGDFDLYLYSSEPSSNGRPVLLASSAQCCNATSEVLSYASPTNSSAFLTIKRIEGSGTASLVTDDLPPPLITLGSPDPVNFVFSFGSLSGRGYSVEYKDSLDYGSWQFLQSVAGDGTIKIITNPLSATQRFYRVAMH